MANPQAQNPQSIRFSDGSVFIAMGTPTGSSDPQSQNPLAVRLSDGTNWVDPATIGGGGGTALAANRSRWFAQARPSTYTAWDAVGTSVGGSLSGTPTKYVSTDGGYINCASTTSSGSVAGVINS